MRAALKQVLERHTTDKSELIPIIQEAQDAIGYLPEDVLLDVSRHLNVPEAAIYGVATFYAQFYLEPQGRHRIRVCRGTACHVRGSAQIRPVIESKLKVKDGQTTDDLLFTYETVACVGCCALAPVMMIDDRYYGRLTPEKAEAVIDEYMRQADAG
ncbi:MAG: NADH-quinone oxidoreductase subunit NuoE [Candidatus Brocadiae bacterium]|nr:NADH-quinone oxidoreductase subunit NuoE [Candidatus Brocadiia bacterium]